MPIYDVTAPGNSSSGYLIHWGMDEFLFTMQGNDLEHGKKADKVEASTFGTRVKNNLPGMQEGNLRVKGLYDGGHATINETLNARFGRRSPVNAWYALEGLNALSPLVFQPSSITDYSVDAKLKDAVGFNAEFDARGAYYDGYILVSPKTLLSATGNGSADVSTTSTTTGGAAFLAVWGISGGTSPSITAKVQHSPDGTTWTDLITFGALTAAGSSLSTIPFGTTVNAQVRGQYTISGTPTGVQVLLGFARGVDLDA